MSNAKTHFIFDLDHTLVVTPKLEVYTRNTEGRELVTKNPKKLRTELVDDTFPHYLKELQDLGHVSIVTNSPREYARFVLDRFGFPKGISLVAHAKKPDHANLEALIDEVGIPHSQTVLIGDDVRDILAAHGAEIASIAVQSHFYSTDEQLAKAEPSFTTIPGKNMIVAALNFHQEKFEFNPRTDPDNYKFLPSHEHYLEPPQVDIHSLGEYHKYRQGSKHPHSLRILLFKAAKDVSWAAIHRGVSKEYYYNGSIRSGDSYLSALRLFGRAVIDKLDSLNLKGSVYVLPVPNSFPEYCYRTDINFQFLKMICQNTPYKTLDWHMVARVHPKPEDHKGQRSSRQVHYQSMGFWGPQNPLNADHIVLFDDVSTVGTQLDCMANILHRCGVEAQYHAIVLGQTVDELER